MERCSPQVFGGTKVKRSPIKEEEKAPHLHATDLNCVACGVEQRASGTTGTRVQLQLLTHRDLGVRADDGRLRRRGCNMQSLSQLLGEESLYLVLDRIQICSSLRCYSQSTSKTSDAD